MMILLLNALTGIALLVIVSLGIAVTVGMMGVINLAHGELVMIGAYTTLLLSRAGIPLLLAMLAAPVVAGLVGWLLEWLIIRHLYGRMIDTLLATAGISMVLIQVARILFSSDSRSVPIPLGSLTLGDTSISAYRLLMIALAVGLLVLTYAIFKFTRYGLEARATALNAPMAAAVGIDAAQINRWTFVLGSALAGVAGAILAPFTTVTPSMSGLFMARAFMTSITGGASILLGTAASASILGWVESVVSFFTTPVLGQVALLSCAVVLLRLFPKGLSGAWGRSL
ncbi:MAG: urea ABC transporter permease subunit UrtB [Synechococcales cyanobacterium]